MGALKGDDMARKEVLKAIGKKAVEGYAAAKKAIGGIKKKSDLERLADFIKKQSVKAQAPGTTLRGGKPGKSKVEKSASAYVKRRKQLRGVGIK